MIMNLFSNKALNEVADECSTYTYNKLADNISELLSSSLQFKGKVSDTSELKNDDMYIDNAEDARVMLTSDSTTGNKISTSINSVLNVGTVGDSSQMFETTYTAPYTTYDSRTYAYEFPQQCDNNYITVELKLRDGSRVIDKFDKRKIYDIRGMKDNDHPGKYYASFKYMSIEGQRSPTTDMIYEVDCSLHDLCYLLKIEYIPFSKTLLEKTVKGDNV